MFSSIRKIGLLILLVIILPVLVFTVFEIGDFRQNEMVIQNIYRNQLDAILFSVNQYSDDIISNLASRIERSVNSERAGKETDLSSLITEMKAVNYLVTFDSSFRYRSSVPEIQGDSNLLAQITAGLNKKSQDLKRLETYLWGGYRKIAAIGDTGSRRQWIAFYTRVKEQSNLNVLVIDPEKFIGKVLDPKIQEITRGKFQIVAFRSGEKTPFYSSDKQIRNGRISEKRPFWLLHDYLMGIEMQNLTIADLARARTKRSLLIIGIMDFILLFGAWLIYRNITRQMELSQLKSDFVSGVSHEIRTPLALISMYIETLEMGRVKSPEKVKEYYNVILNETTRLSGIVNRILSFSQIESNKRKYVFGETNLNEIVESAALSFRYTMESKGFSFSFKPDDALPVISADREAATEAVVNLLDNAMKYSTEDKSIVIRTGNDDHYVYVEVEDHGIGISEKDQKLIFDKFYRVTEKNLANRVKGSGLGLAIVKHIMEAHEGRIYVKSTPGSGSLFRLLFPVKQNYER